MRPKRDKDLHKARQLTREQRFSRVISLLSPQIFLYRSNPEFYRLLGTACLYTNDFGGAHTYFARSIDLKPDQIQSRLGLAAIYLKRGKITEALQQWLDVIAISPNNRRAKYGLAYAKTLDESSLEAREMAKGLQRRIYPGTGWNFRPIVFLFLIILGLSALALPISFLLGNLQSSQSLQREGGEYLDLSSSVPRLATSGSFTRILTSAQLDSLIDSIRQDFHSYRDNRARYSINQILSSNASEDVKTQMRLLSELLRQANFVDEFWSPEPEDIQKDPSAYEDLFIKWKGKIGNLRINPEQILFDFLVGYHEESVVRAIVPVRLEFAAELHAGENIELIGRLRSVGGSYMIEGSSLRMLR